MYSMFQQTASSLSYHIAIAFNIFVIVHNVVRHQHQNIHVTIKGVWNLMQLKDFC